MTSQPIEVAGKARRGRPKGSRNAYLKRELLTCEQCGINFLVRPYEGGRRRYCSRDCSGTGMAQRERARVSEDVTERNEWIAASYLAGYTLHEVGVSHGLTRERVRQIVWKLTTPEQRAEARRERFLAFQRANARPERTWPTLKCFVCWAEFTARSALQLNRKRTYCTQEHRDLYRTIKHYIDPMAHREALARSVIRHPERQPGSYGWAARTLAGIAPKRKSFNGPNPESAAYQAYLEVLRLREGKTPPNQEL